MHSATCSELVEILGVEAAMRLARHFPGYPVPVPKETGDSYVLAQALNEDEMGRMIARFSGQQVRVPVALARYATLTLRNERIRARALHLANAGNCAESIPLQIAREENLTYAFIRNILAGWDPEFPVDGALATHASAVHRAHPIAQMELL